ncbi:FHA domain-containing protein [Nocardia sp. CDC159]|uniref:FHA domain-containing protein n=1 Tax=Nocardia pulmonis TaxID=2951408 RepID=A0A9X2E0Q9_9NOCA|nr:MULTISPECIES: BTAD domain-containing putative transcriptional regulator [Nocardia]MCM6771887.1 FHA domain-containing protein [Nocardia pulmonis]MCM6785455.1 FHA domain-containing protein [Nocardia sp. CDC159]
MPDEKVPSVDVRLLGPVCLLVDGSTLNIGGTKSRAVLAMLAVNRRRVVSSRALANGIWNGRPPRRFAPTLHVFVADIRKALRTAGTDPAAIVRTINPGYQLDLPDNCCDVARFESERAAATAAAAAGDHAGALEHFDAALAQWSGDPLADLRDLEFADNFAAELVDRRMTTVLGRVDAEIALGHAAETVGAMAALAAEHPVNEAVWRRLVTALYLAGRQAEALDACRRLRTNLAELEGLDPDPVTLALERQVRRQQPLLPIELPRGGTTLETTQSAPRAALRLSDGRTVEIDSGIRIGRLPDNDLVVDDARVSRHHARLVVREAGMLLVDLGSANGTYVNGTQIVDDTLLTDGDTIRIGSTAMRVEILAEE